MANRFKASAFARLVAAVLCVAGGNRWPAIKHHSVTVAMLITAIVLFGLIYKYGRNGCDGVSSPRIGGVIEIGGC